MTLKIILRVLLKIVTSLVPGSHSHLNYYSNIIILARARTQCIQQTQFAPFIINTMSFFKALITTGTCKSNDSNLGTATSITSRTNLSMVETRLMKSLLQSP